MHMVSGSSEVLSFNLSEDFKNSFVQDLLMDLNSAVGNLNNSKAAVKILSSIVFSYNKSGIDGLRKILKFWSQKNNNGFLKEIIKKEINKEQIDKNKLDELFNQADSLAKDF